MRPVALFWPYNDAQQRRLLRIIDEYFIRSAPECTGRAVDLYGSGKPEHHAQANRLLNLLLNLLMDGLRATR